MSRTLLSRPLSRVLLLASIAASMAVTACGDDGETTSSGSGGGSGTGGADGSGGGTGGATGGTTTGAGGGGGESVALTAPAIGNGDAAAVTFETVYDEDTDRLVTDLDFHPTRDELWVVLREPFDDTPCTDAISAGCGALEGSVAIVTGPATGAPTAEWKQDRNAWHFMRRPTGIAFTDADEFATISEYRTGNYTDDPADFIGPSLWSADPEIFSIQPPGKNGSHLDMLHETPWGMGIAHETGRVFWTFNGDIGALDRYDFVEPHEVGGSDHADGTLHRYAEGSFLRVEDVPSHVAIDTNWVYVADTGNGRVARLDFLSGTVGTPISPWETMALATTMEGAVVEDFVPAGVLSQPSGIAIAGTGIGAVFYVGDHASGTIVAFDSAGTEIARLATDLPGLSGLAIGPDGGLYAASYDDGRVVRLVVAP
jgi:hypothetical protein